MRGDETAPRVGHLRGFGEGALELFFLAAHGVFGLSEEREMVEMKRRGEREEKSAWRPARWTNAGEKKEQLLTRGSTGVAGRSDENLWSGEEIQLTSARVAAFGSMKPNSLCFLSASYVSTML